MRLASHARLMVMKPIAGARPIFARNGPGLSAYPALRMAAEAAMP
jgi:hypothetical protein